MALEQTRDSELLKVIGRRIREETSVGCERSLPEAIELQMELLRQKEERAAADDSLCCRLPSDT